MEDLLRKIRQELKEINTGIKSLGSDISDVYSELSTISANCSEYNDEKINSKLDQIIEILEQK